MKDPNTQLGALRSTIQRHSTAIAMASASTASALPLASPQRPLNRDEDYNSKTANVIDNILFLVSVILFTLVLLMTALSIFAICFKRCRSRRRRLSFLRDPNSAGRRRLPLDKSVVQSFPVFVYESKDQGLDCAVCLCEFEENEKGRRLPLCNHSFHMDCIDRWFDSNSTCPLCRTAAAPALALALPLPLAHPSSAVVTVDA